MKFLIEKGIDRTKSNTEKPEQPGLFLLSFSFFSLFCLTFSLPDPHFSFFSPLSTRPDPTIFCSGQLVPLNLDFLRRQARSEKPRHDREELKPAVRITWLPHPSVAVSTITPQHRPSSISATPREASNWSDPRR